MESTGKNNHLRQMGALWSIARLSKYLNDPRYDNLTNKGIEYFSQYFKHDKKGNFTYVNIDPDEIKLGYSAFMILSLLESSHPHRIEYSKELANGILQQQQDGGAYKTYFYSDSDSGKDYYPGEAMVSLMALYDETHDPYIFISWKSPSFYKSILENQYCFVPWQTQAYAKLYMNFQILKRQTYIRHEWFYDRAE